MLLQASQANIDMQGRWIQSSRAEIEKLQHRLGQQEQQLQRLRVQLVVSAGQTMVLMPMPMPMPLFVGAFRG